MDEHVIAYYQHNYSQLTTKDEMVTFLNNVPVNVLIYL